MANALEAASLVMIPSGYEDGTLGSLKPIDGSGDFTFTRGTDIGATRVAPDGYIEKGYENLLLQSNTFSDAAWGKSNTSVTSGQSGYDGTNDAWLVSITGGTGSQRLQVSGETSVGVITISVYVKQADTSYFRINSANAGANTIFDLSNGTILSSSAIYSTITSVGNDWYRVSVSINKTAAGNLFLYVGESGATSGSIYIQDAMLNQGLVAMPYLPTTTTTSVGGILANQPRIDFTGGGCGSLLLEPSRTNTAPSSGYLAPIWYVHSNISPTYNNAISPEGVNNATLFEATGNNPRFNYNATGTPAGYNAYSIFAKAGTSSYLRIRIYDGSTNHDAVFDLTDGSFSGLTSGVVAFGEDYGNGWFRVGISYNQTNAGTAYTQLYISDTSVGSVYLYGLQFEKTASYPTSLIATYGTSVTRAADVCVGAGNSSTFNSTEGVLYVEISALANENLQRNLSISNGTHNNSVQLGFLNNATDYRFFANVRLGGISQAFLTFNFGAVAPTFKKCAIKYKENDFALWIDGVEVATDTSGNTFTENTLNELSFTRGGTAQPFYGKTKQVLTFNTALSDAELAELTTI
jgi:hypothetical protein